MTDRIKTLDEPLLLTEIRSFPRRYILPSGRLDSVRMRIDLGILSDDDLKSALLALYRLDVGVAHRVDERLARALVAQLTGAPLPVTRVPPEEESRWLAAEGRCEACPGSQTAPVFEGGPTMPLCLAVSRLDRWETCMQFSEGLMTSTLPDETPVSSSVVDDFEREVDEISKKIGSDRR